MKKKNRIWIFPYVIMGMCLMLISNCNQDKIDEPTQPVDASIKVTMTNGDVIYSYPTDNGISVKWGVFGIDITNLGNKPTIETAQMDLNGEANTVAIVAHLGNNNGTPYAPPNSAPI